MKRPLMLWIAACMAWTVSARTEPLLIMQENYPRAFFFRIAEAKAADASVPYAQWDATFSRLMGIEGKALDEEHPERMATNVRAFTQFKQNHPEQLVLLHFCGRARDPRFQTENYFSGHWVYYNGARITADVPEESGETDIHVGDSGPFMAGDDVGLCALDANGKPDWGISEQTRVLSVDSDGKTLRVTRGLYGATPRAFSRDKAYAAAHVAEVKSEGPRVPDWYYNHSLTCPRDVQGRTCADILNDQLAAYFAPGGEIETFDGVALDVLNYDIGASNKKSRGPDCDADGVRDDGVVGGMNVYGAGVIEFCRELRQKLGDGKFILGDGQGDDNQRAEGLVSGVESEGWPHLRDGAIADWSGGMNRLLFWQANARPSIFNYINHKFIVPGHGEGEKHMEVPYSTHRLVFAAAQILGVAICSSNEAPADKDELAGIWDEFWKGAAHERGWLGKPVGASRRLAAEQPDVFQGAGAPAASAVLSNFSGNGVGFEIENGRLKVTATGDKKELEFTLRNVPCNGPDLYLSITAQGGPFPGYPPDMPRRMTVKSIEGVETPTEHYTWVNGKDFTSTFYYGDVTGPTAQFRITVEGASPLWLTLTGHAHPDAVVREFEHGLVAANPSLQDYTFDLESLFPGQRFRRFQGTALQDPATNNGAPVAGPLALGPKDALFLAKE